MQQFTVEPTTADDQQVEDDSFRADDAPSTDSTTEPSSPAGEGPPQPTEEESNGTTSSDPDEVSQSSEQETTIAPMAEIGPAAMVGPWNIDGIPGNSGETRVPDGCYGKTETDDVPTSGQAIVDYPNVTVVDSTTNKNSKSDFCAVYLDFAEVGDDMYFYLGWEIVEGTTGTVTFYQTFENTSTTDGTGDILLRIEFTPDTGIITVSTYEYVGANQAWTLLPTGGTASGIVVDSANLQDSSDGEVVINLTAAGVFGSDGCESFVSGNLYSASGGSELTSNLADVVEGTGLSISNCGSLTVEKVGFGPSDPNDATVFGYLVGRTGDEPVKPVSGSTPAVYSIDGDLRIDDIDTHTGILAGNDFTLVEDALGADVPWTHVSTVCTVDENTYTLTSPESEFPIEVGETTECVITNATAKVDVVKNTEGADGTFGFTLTELDEFDEPTATTQTVSITTTDNTGTETFGNLKPGTTWAIDETTLPDGWTKGDFTCEAQPVEGEPRPLIAAGFTLENGDTVTCTVTNTAQGDLTIDKDTLPAGADQDFAFTVTPVAEGADPIPGFDLNDSINDGINTIEDLAPGDYFIQEGELPAGWVFESIVVSVNGVDMTEPNVDEARGVTVTLEPGDEIVITYTNKKLGTAAWNKIDGAIDAETPTLLTGSEWLLSGPLDQDPVPAVEISDCVAETPEECVGPDMDPAGGQFLVVDLAWGEYELRETVAPAGYSFDTEPRLFEIGAEDGEGVTILDVDLGQIENFPISGPELPLTGGLGRDFFLISGLVVLAAGLGAATYLQIRRRRGEA